jgi:hypothetical protein
MHIRLVFLAALACVGCASAHAAPPAQSARAPDAVSHHVYRFDFIITTADNGKPAVSSSYTLNLEERQSGEVRVGSNIVLSPSAARMDVGLKIWCSYRFEGADIVLREQTEMSTAEDPSTIHKVSSTSEAWVVPGTPTLVASMDEPVSHKRYQVMVTATKLL